MDIGFHQVWNNEFEEVFELKYPDSVKEKAVQMRILGLSKVEIAKQLGVHRDTVDKWLRAARATIWLEWDKAAELSVKRKQQNDLSSELIEEALCQIDEGKNDTEISVILGLSTYNIRKIRDDNNRPRSQQWTDKQLSPEQINDIIDLIREGGTLRQISDETGISKRKVKELREQEIREGNTLPEFKKGVARRQKYTDEELIELAFLNPGYGFKRFTERLGVGERFVLNLFIEFKEFTDGEEDPLATLQDPSFVSWVTKAEYKRVVGGNLPKGYSGKGATGGSNKNLHARQALVPVPPINFNWGSFSPKPN